MDILGKPTSVNAGAVCDMYIQRSKMDIKSTRCSSCCASVSAMCRLCILLSYMTLRSQARDVVDGRVGKTQLRNPCCSGLASRLSSSHRLSSSKTKPKQVSRPSPPSPLNSELFPKGFFAPCVIIGQGYDLVRMLSRFQSRSQPCSTPVSSKSGLKTRLRPCSKASQKPPNLNEGRDLVP